MPARSIKLQQLLEKDKTCMPTCSEISISKQVYYDTFDSVE